jgi:hypothetical protein
MSDIKYRVTDAREDVYQRQQALLRIEGVHESRSLDHLKVSSVLSKLKELPPDATELQIAVAQWAGLLDAAQTASALAVEWLDVARKRERTALDAYNALVTEARALEQP